MLSKCFIRNDGDSGSLHNGATGHMHVLGSINLFTCLKPDPILLQSQKLHIYMMVSGSDSNYKIHRIKNLILITYQFKAKNSKCFGRNTKCRSYSKFMAMAIIYIYIYITGMVIFSSKLIVLKTRAQKSFKTLTLFVL